jgi:hypothetical protein
MKANFGAVVVAGSGKLGGQYFQGGKTGHSLRTINPRVKKVSPSISNIQRLRAQISRGWRDLSETQRKSWESGSIPELNGFEWFNSVNYFRLRIGVAMVSTPLTPVHALTFTFNTVSIDISLARIFCNYSPGTSANARIMFYATRPLGVGITFIKSSLVFIARSTSNTSMNFNIWNEYVTKFGVPPVNAYIWVRAVAVDIASGSTRDLGTKRGIVLP